jgi:flavin reductase
MAEPGERDELKEAFLGAMARVVSSVTIVTTDGPAGRFGVTVSAMSSVSADPPMLLVCINKRSPASKGVTANRRFGVNVLAADQVEVARIFAGRPRAGTPFDFTATEWVEQVTGSPILKHAVAAFDCRLHHTHDEGTHRIFIGEVLEAVASPGDPLLYGRRTFKRPAPID